MIGKSWSRADNRILEAALWLALLLVGLFGAILPLLGVAGPLSPISIREVELADLAQLPDTASAGSVTLRGTRTAELVFDHPDFAERLLLVLPNLIETLLLLVILEFLRRIVRSLRDGDVFIAHNARRLTAVALAVLAIALMVPMVDAVTTHLLANTADLSARIPFSYTISGSFLLRSSSAALVRTHISTVSQPTRPDC